MGVDTQIYLPNSVNPLNGANNGEAWDMAQRAIFNLKPITQEEIEAAAKFAAYPYDPKDYRFPKRLKGKRKMPELTTELPASSQLTVRMSNLIPISSVRIGQRFSWGPNKWYGPCRMTEKNKRIDYVGIPNSVPFRMQKVIRFDVKFDVKCDGVDFLGVVYGVASTTKIRLIKDPK